MMNKQICNPYLPTYEYVPDGEIHIFDGRAYVFGSHDRFSGEKFCMNDYVCWSAPVDDLKSWTYHGVIYRREQDPTPIRFLQHHMWAPDCVQGADGRYYLYYALEWLNRVAVAVCDTPCGKYEFYGEVRYQNGIRYGGMGKELSRFDPGVLNDSGRFYLYTGFSYPHSGWIARKMKMQIKALGNQVVELASDMLTVISEPKPLLPGINSKNRDGFEGHEFFEASSMRKFDGKYYAVYSSVKGRELCYAVSDYPDRDFVYGGVLHDNGNVKDGCDATFYWGNNHGCLARINGNYYVFGHRQTYKNHYSRQGVAEPIVFENGRFLQAEMTSQGLNGQPLSCTDEYEAGVACVLYRKKPCCHNEKKKRKDPYITQDGADRECDPMQYIANMRSGTVAGYKYFNIPENGVQLTLILRRHNCKGVLQIAHDDKFTDLREEAILSDEVSFSLNSKGKRAIFLRFIGKGSIDLIKLKWSDNEKASL